MVSFGFKTNYPSKETAYLVQENPLQKAGWVVEKHATNIRNLGPALMQGKADDYKLGVMNDTTVRMGSLGIATLANARVFSSVSGLNEFIGFACWFASMGLSPKIINTMLNMKYGLDLDMEYVDSYGRRKKLFEDPGFICWDLIPPEKIDQIGDRMGIPKNVPNRREAIQEKIRQVVIQSKTWMMITAGFTTPVLASVIADTLKKPVSSLRGMLHQRKFNKIVKEINSLSVGQDTAKIERLLKKLVKKTFGTSEAAEISRLWNSAPDQVISKAGMTKGPVENLTAILNRDGINVSGFKGWIPRIATLYPKANEAQKTEALVKYMMENTGKMDAGIQVIDANIAKAQGWHDIIMGIFDKHQLQSDEFKLLREFVDVRLADFKAGFGNTRNVLDKATGRALTEKELQLFAEYLSGPASLVKPELLKDLIKKAAAKTLTPDEMKSFAAKIQNPEFAPDGMKVVESIVEKVSGKGLNAAELKDLLKGVNIASVFRIQVDNKFDSLSAWLLGRSKQEVSKFQNLIEGQHGFCKTIETTSRISKTPFNFIDHALQDNLLHKNWLKRIGGFGLVLLGATALYAFFGTGHSNQYNPAARPEKRNY